MELIRDFNSFIRRTLDTAGLTGSLLPAYLVK
jgi:hypothetical protein